MMFIFEGWQYTTRIDVVALQRVKTLAALDLIALVRGQLANEMAADPIVLCEALWALIKPQADANGLTQEAFYRGLRGDVLAEATRALLEGVADFFPTRERELMMAALAKANEVREALLQAQEAQLARIDPGSLTQSLLKASGAPSSSAPASAASTQPG